MKAEGIPSAVRTPANTGTIITMWAKSCIAEHKYLGFLNRQCHRTLPAVILVHIGHFRDAGMEGVVQVGCRTGGMQKRIYF